MTTINGVNTGLSGSTGTGSFVGSSSPAITTPNIITGLKDVNGNLILAFSPTSSAVNYFSFSNQVTGSAPSISAIGSDAAVPFSLFAKNSVFQLLDSSATVGASLRFFNAAGSFYTGLGVAAAQGASVDFKLPAADGSSSAPLITDGAGNLSFLPGAWVDFSGSVGATGFTAPPTVANAKYKKIGKTVFIEIALSGTSNATSFTITGLPFTIANAGFIPLCYCEDNTLINICSGSISGTTLTLYFGVTSLVNGWTNSGAKGIDGRFFYETT